MSSCENNRSAAQLGLGRELTAGGQHLQTSSVEKQATLQLPGTGCEYQPGQLNGEIKNFRYVSSMP